MKSTPYGLILACLLIMAGCDATAVEDPAAGSASPAMESAASDGLSKATQMDVCHLRKGTSIYDKITIATTALPGHLLHGDGLPGEAVPGIAGSVFDENCVPVQQMNGLVAEYDMVQGADPNILYDISGNNYHRTLNGQTYNAEGLNFMGQPTGAGAPPSAAWTIVMATNSVVDIIDSNGGAYTDLAPDAGLVPRIYTDWESPNAFFGTFCYRMEFDRVLTAAERTLVDGHVRGILEARIAGFGQDDYKKKVPNSAFRDYLAWLPVHITDLAGLQSVSHLPLHFWDPQVFSTSPWHDWRGIRHATSLTDLQVWGINIRGTLAEISTLANLQTLVAHSNNDRLIGDLSDLAGLTSLSTLNLGGLSAVTGEISDLAPLPLTDLILAFTAVTGNTTPLAGKLLKSFEANGTAITGHLDDINDGPLQRLFLQSQPGFIGDIGLLENKPINFIFINSTGITGDITGVIETWNTADLWELSISDMGLTGNVGVGIAATSGKMVRIHLDGNSFTSAQIDEAVVATHALLGPLCAVKSDIQFEDQHPPAPPSAASIAMIDDLNQAGCVVTYDP